MYLRTYSLVIFLAFFSTVTGIKVEFVPNLATTIYLDEVKEINFTIIFENDDSNRNTTLFFASDNEKLASVQESVFSISAIKSMNGSFLTTGLFLGRTSISCRNSTGAILTKLDIVIIRKPRIIDTIFTVSVVLLVSLVAINFGCTMDWSKPKEILKKPVGPAAGFFGQFIFMPLVSYGLGKLIFPENPGMQLGLFFTGISPGGGASNIWTALLDGNLSLSLIMSAMGNISAFFMMPLWLFTLGKLIFDKAQLEVPYTQLLSYIIGLIVPLGIGYLIQRYLTKIAATLVKWSKYIMTFVLVFIILFAIITNLYLFALFSWEIIVAGASLPWIGFAFGYTLARIIGQPAENCTAIALENGIENTGIAIFLLRFALPQPEADLTTVVPVAISIFTPLPLATIVIYKKIKQRLTYSKGKTMEELKLDRPSE